MRNLRSVAFAFLELLAFNAQKFTGSRDLTTPPFQNFFMVMLGLSLVACNPSVMFASFTILELLAFNAQNFWVHVSHAPFYRFDIFWVGGRHNTSYELRIAIIGCVINISASLLRGCFRNIGVYFWTAGQRIDPSRQSRFVWRATATNGYTKLVSGMSYSNWDIGQPTYLYNGNIEACIILRSGRAYTWNDYRCSVAACSVCEIDM